MILAVPWVVLANPFTVSATAAQMRLIVNDFIDRVAFLANTG
jgi:hypothetical protein